MLAPTDLVFRRTMILNFKTKQDLFLLKYGSDPFDPVSTFYFELFFSLYKPGNLSWHMKVKASTLFFTVQ